MKKANNKSMPEQTGVLGSADETEKTFSKGGNYSKLAEC
jgi:hypothetical protein